MAINEFCAHEGNQEEVAETAEGWPCFVLPPPPCWILQEPKKESDAAIVVAEKVCIEKGLDDKDV